MARPPRFHTKPLRRRHNTWLKRIMPWLSFLVVVGAAVIIMRLPIGGGDWERVDTRFSLCEDRDSNGCVIDGDTIMFGQGKTARKIRLTGYNAPEMTGECPAESALAIQSRGALQSWLNQGPFDMSEGADPPYDQYGRELRSLKRGDEWLSEVMVARELAQESGWGFVRGGWCG